MRIFLIVAALIAAYVFYHDHASKADQNAFYELVSELDTRPPINQFEIKNSLNKQVKARCKSLAHDDGQIEKMNECLEMHESYQAECELKIFRLAPVEFENENEAVDYGKRYQKCLFNKRFSFLIDSPTTL